MEVLNNRGLALFGSSEGTKSIFEKINPGDAQIEKNAYITIGTTATLAPE